MHTNKRLKQRGLRVLPEKEHPVSIDINGENFLDIVRAIDISERGLGIRVPHEFKDCHIDKLVSLIVELPHPVNQHFTVQGKIRHKTDKVFGVTFIGLHGTERKKLQKYIAYRIKDEPLIVNLKFKLRAILDNLRDIFYHDQSYGPA